MKPPPVLPGVFAQMIAFKDATFCKRCGCDCYPVVYLEKLTHNRGACLKCQTAIIQYARKPKKKPNPLRGKRI